MIRRFQLRRTEDVSGVSGTGVVAEGVEFTGGAVSLRWLGGWPTSVVFHDRGVESVEHIHGHGGRTELVWLDVEGRDPNAFARELADLRDENHTLQKCLDEVREQLTEMADERDSLAHRLAEMADQ